MGLAATGARTLGGADIGALNWGGGGIIAGEGERESVLLELRYCGLLLLLLFPVLWNSWW